MANANNVEVPATSLVGSKPRAINHGMKYQNRQPGGLRHEGCMRCGSLERVAHKDKIKT
jgi:hypothetical protein